MSLRRAARPFRFFIRLTLTEATGVRAHDLGELLEGIRSLPESAIYAHTHRFIAQHQFLAGEPANDFAVWVSEALQDQAAAERLLAVDAVRYKTIADLRAALVAALEAHLKEGPSDRVAPRDDEFHFLRTTRFSLPTERLAWDLAEFRDGLREAGPASLYLHVFEARLRPPLGANDFSTWLSQELGEEELARRIAALDPYSHSSEQLRDRMVGMVSERLEGGRHA